MTKASSRRVCRRAVLAGGFATLAAPFVIGLARAAEQRLTGQVNGSANYAIRKPERWKGTLLAYAHPYRVAADSKSAEPHLTFSPKEAAYFPDLEPLLIESGYALAGVAFRRQGYAIREGIEDTAAAVRQFHRSIGKPERTILYGTSLGSLIALEGAERSKELYDGALPLSSLAAGGLLIWDRVLDFMLAFDAAFGWPAAWGRPGAVRSDIDFGKEVVPLLRGLLGDARSRPKFEFMRAIGDFPAPGFYDGKMPLPWLFGNMFFGTHGAAELQRRAGGNALESARAPYALPAAEAARLEAAGADVAALLAALNAPTRRVDADPAARAYLAANYSPSGDLEIPVLSIHSINDGLAAISNETVLRANAAKAGRSGRLRQVFTDVVGHNAFSPRQMVAAFAAMERWIRDGVAPAAEAFPQSDGFLGAYELPPWPRT